MSLPLPIMVPSSPMLTRKPSVSPTSRYPTARRYAVSPTRGCSTSALSGYPRSPMSNSRVIRNQGSSLNLVPPAIPQVSFGSLSSMRATLPTPMTRSATVTGSFQPPTLDYSREYAASQTSSFQAPAFAFSPTVSSRPVGRLPATPTVACRAARVITPAPTRNSYSMPIVSAIEAGLNESSVKYEGVTVETKLVESGPVESMFPDELSPKSLKKLQGLTAYSPAANFDHFDEEEEDKQATLQHHVFEWLDWAPSPDTVCYEALHKNFPGALPGPAVHHRITEMLHGEFDFTIENTLLGASICPDEINNVAGGLPDLMKGHWGPMFPLGGISGAPFVGATGFKAFSHHVPDDGDIIILFGPHVAVSMEGKVGTYLREGQHEGSTACGAVIGAYNACSAAKTGKKEMTIDEVDLQMEWIKAQIGPHCDRIQAQANPLGALAYQAYEMVKAKIEKIVNLDFGSGRLVLVGGIQINMPVPLQDHFLPLMFEIQQKGQPSESLLEAFHCDTSQEAQLEVDSPIRRRSSLLGGLNMGKSSQFGEWAEVKAANFDHSQEAAEDRKAVKQQAVFHWLTWGPEPGSPCFATLHKEFPGALPGQGVHCRVQAILRDNYGFTPENALFGTSICPDEINFQPNGIARSMADYWGEVFPMGGIGGAPFAGKTGFKAFSHHVPDDGHVIVLYGPHVGISSSGEVGKYLREGQHHDSTACGAVVGGYNHIIDLKDGEDIEFDEADIQMGWIKSQIAPHATRIKRQPNPMAALAYQAYESVKYKIDQVVNTDFGTGCLVLIGGIMINMPHPCREHFLPLTFEMRQAGKETISLDGAFHIPFPDEHDNFHHAGDVVAGA